MRRIKYQLLVFFLILIGVAGTAYGQYLGDKVPPKIMYDDEIEEDVFPPLLFF